LWFLFLVDGFLFWGEFFYGFLFDWGGEGGEVGWFIVLLDFLFSLDLVFILQAL